MTEWRECPSFPSMKADNTGVIAGRFRIRKFDVDKKTGYCSLSVYCPVKRGRKKAYVHTLVADAWIGPRPDGMEINHIDGNKQNNAPSNLDYVTSSENNKHAYSIGLRRPSRAINRRCGDSSNLSKLTDEQASEIKARRAAGESVKSLAKKFEVTPQAIRYVINKRRTRDYHGECGRTAEAQNATGSTVGGNVGGRIPPETALA